MRLDTHGWLIAAVLAAACAADDPTSRSGHKLSSHSDGDGLTYGGDTYGGDDDDDDPDADPGQPDAEVVVIHDDAYAGDDAGGDDMSGDDTGGDDMPGDDTGGDDTGGDDAPPDAGYSVADAAPIADADWYPPDGCVMPPDAPYEPVVEDPYLICMGKLFHARETYYDQLVAAIAGQPPEPAGPGEAMPSITNLAGLGTAVETYVQPDVNRMSSAAAAAYIKLEELDYAFYMDRLVYNGPLLACWTLIQSLPEQPGEFADYPPTPPPPPDGGPVYCNVFNNADEPAEPRPNCFGEVHATWISHLAGAQIKNDTVACEDYDYETARATGLSSLASGGDRKAAKRSKAGPNCDQAAPVMNVDVGIHTKPYAVFRPMWIRIQETGEKPKYVKNDKAKFSFDVPDPKGGAMVKRGATCPAGTELTFRTIAEMKVLYYVNAGVWSDEDGKGGGSMAFEARVEIDQKCYGPGTQVTAPGSFSVVASEQDEKIRLSVLPDCEATEQWNAALDLNAQMAEKPGVGFGFHGGNSTTQRCKLEMDKDKFATGGCVANQNFSNTSFTTKPQNGLLQIGAMYQFYNPADPAGAAPIGFLGMGMALSGMQARAKTSVESPMGPGVAAGGLATVLWDRKKISDKAGDPSFTIELGANTCAMQSAAGQRPADECKIPKASWPIVLETARNTKPKAQDMVDAWQKAIDKFAAYCK
jgi:hypothetical protein